MTQSGRQYRCLCKHKSRINSFALSVVQGCGRCFFRSRTFFLILSEEDAMKATMITLVGGGGACLAGAMALYVATPSQKPSVAKRSGAMHCNCIKPSPARKTA